MSAGCSHSNRSPANIRSLVKQHQVVVQLLYGKGLRVNEALRLRVKDVDLEQDQFIVRDGKGAQDRVSILLESILEQLKSHLVTLKISTNRISVMEKGVWICPIH